MRLARFEGHAQRLARTEDVLLPDHLVEAVRTESFGERDGHGRAEKKSKTGVKNNRRQPDNADWRRVALHACSLF
ncbi:hypothetical protein GCM10007205_27110 [Oxalicibacterium flavum]|uniref:Uncharacterized protein n=1 Tax=Oxalicibacterium flavum TaxID=179467 RepID=A0A8J2UM60_9BURK|nr:hypothetical protein GCM10007205_27110 [Oxalicibacterium flavum]